MVGHGRRVAWGGVIPQPSTVTPELAEAALNCVALSRARKLANPHVGELPLDRAVDQFYTADVFMHTWDLARATGQDDRLDAGFCGQLLAGMEQFEEAMRSSGQYGARVEVSEDAGPQARLLGFIGRDPYWSPPRAIAT